MHCGHNHVNSKYIEKIKLNQNFITHFNSKYKEKVWKPSSEKTLYTSYLGPVDIPVIEAPVENHFFLQTSNPDNILIKVVDVKQVIEEFGMLGLPDVEFLLKIPPTQINSEENKDTYEKIVKCNQLINKYSHDQDLVELLQGKLKQLYAKNIPVDIYYNTIKYLQFLKDKFKLKNINSSKEIISIYNIPDFDNAFFTGDYMVYGNGEFFYPLGSSDIISHELTHGLTEHLCQLEYENESGALNEAFSDIFAISFKNWLYNKFDIGQLPTWLIGDSIGINGEFLRSFEKPESSSYPQPSKYKGEHWSFSRNDNGGVHTNSGVANHLFYLICQDIPIKISIDIFYKCLKNLNKNSDYKEFSTILIQVTPDEYKDIINKHLSSLLLS